MEKKQLLDKAQEALSPFETENIIKFVKEVNFKTFIDNPLMSLFLLAVLIYALVKHSKFSLLLVFCVLSLAVLIHYTLPGAGEAMTVKSGLPFAFGCLGIGAVILYFVFIKTD